MCCGEGETLQILLACVWSDLSVWALLGLPPLMACMLSLSILLRLQVALQGNSLEQALGCVHFQGLSCSGSGPWVLHKGTDSVGPAFCALPRSEQLRRSVLGDRTVPRWAVHLITSPIPASRASWVRSGRAVSGVRCVSSGELIYGCTRSGGCQPSRIPGRLG